MDMITHRELNTICYHPDIKTIKTTPINHPKVLEQENENCIIKLFHRKKKWFSSDRIWPRAVRFNHNVNVLKKYGFNVPAIIKFQYCPQDKIHIIHYEKITGQDIRTVTHQGNLVVLNDVAKLLASLHQKGIFFRSLHLGNLILKSNQQIALIDICDVRYRWWSLSLIMRYRNLLHLLKNRDDKLIWQNDTIDKFLKNYFAETQLSNWQQKILRLLLDTKLR